MGLGSRVTVELAELQRALGETLALKPAPGVPAFSAFEIQGEREAL